MAGPDRPGMSFTKMFDLIYANNMARSVFPDRLLIGIFWEESFFNNIHQIGEGTAVGFGQVEPAEFYKLKEFDLTLPVRIEQKVTKKGDKYKKTYAGRHLTDVEAVKATAGLLLVLHRRLGTVQAALEGYGGVQWARSNPGAKPSAQERLNIIEGWKGCASALESCRPFRKPTRQEEDDILNALQLARGFAPRREEFRPILFPGSDYR